MRSTVPFYKYMYVYDGTLFEVRAEVDDSHLQDATDDILAWSEANWIKLKTQKTQEMIICFCRNEDYHGSIPNISIDGSVVARVTEAKILEVTVSSDLTWNRHVRSITAKAEKRLYMLYQFKKSGRAGVGGGGGKLQRPHTYLNNNCQVRVRILFYCTDSEKGFEMYKLFPGYSYSLSGTTGCKRALFIFRPKTRGAVQILCGQN